MRNTGGKRILREGQIFRRQFRRFFGVGLAPCDCRFQIFIQCGDKGAVLRDKFFGKEQPCERYARCGVERFAPELLHVQRARDFLALLFRFEQRQAHQRFGQVGAIDFAAQEQHQRLRRRCGVAHLRRGKIQPRLFIEDLQEQVGHIVFEGDDQAVLRQIGKAGNQRFAVRDGSGDVVQPFAHDVEQFDFFPLVVEVGGNVTRHDGSSDFAVEQAGAQLVGTAPDLHVKRADVFRLAFLRGDGEQHARRDRWPPQRQFVCRLRAHG